jgi:hypothetical protein
MQVSVTISAEDAQTFFSCLGIGVLQCIRDGAVPPVAGIWTLGRSIVWETLRDAGLMSSSGTEVLSTFDEIDAVSKLMPHELEAELEELMTTLRNIVQESEFQGWRISLEVKE